MRRKMYRIFLVEDDSALADIMEKLLAEYGNNVVRVRDFSRIAEEFEECCPQLVLMDIMLPYRDGYFWCTEIRKQSSVPIVFVSSASDNMNVIMAINMGGDDFIQKPVDPMLFNAKIQAVLRRSYEMNSLSNRIEFCGAFLNVSDYSVSFNGTRTELTKNEFRILQILLENRGRIVSRDDIMIRLWQNDLYVEENTLTVNVGRLRKKLENCGLNNIITTKSGSGYIIQ